MLSTSGTFLKRILCDLQHKPGVGRSIDFFEGQSTRETYLREDFSCDVEEAGQALQQVWHGS